MTSYEKIIKLTEITAGTDVEAGQLATLLDLMGKLDASDVAKVIWTAIGTANALALTQQCGTEVNQAERNLKTESG
ncbi:MAG: hypothetical protein K2O29_02325 [Ruminococcus sp.]|nr:hypothetical protein [Ruminococcus sp.]MDE6849246.1 hypothetical protein [Ruminococcus sp.]MDE7137284.1 hypothetical protein [Ruminococcus sp.]